MNQTEKSCAVVAREFAKYEIIGLNTVSAFVNLRDTHIAHQLLLAPLANKTVTAKYLLAMYRGFQA